MSGGGIGGLIVLGTVAWVGYWGYQSLNGPRGDDYITIYEKVCSSKSPDSSVSYFDCKNAGGATWLSASTFRVDYERQRVFALGLWTTRYDNCKVADKENWICGFADGSGSIQIGDGRFGGRVGRPAQQISWFEYMTGKK